MDSTAQPLHVRIGHWLNALAIFVMLWSGFAMFASDRKFAWIAHAIPAWLWAALQMQGHAVVGRAWHLAFAIVVMANALWYAIAAVRTGTWRRILPNGRTWLVDAARATVAEIRDPRPTMQPASYNGAQKVAYTAVIGMALVMILTGVALWFPRQLPWLSAAMGGKQIVLPVHVILATLLLLFIVVHVVQVLRAGLPTLLAMIVGTTEVRPQTTRRALAFSGAVLASVVIGFTVLRATSGPTGVPPYLQWTVEHHGRGGHRPPMEANAARSPD